MFGEQQCFNCLYQLSMQCNEAIDCKDIKTQIEGHIYVASGNAEKPLKKRPGKVNIYVALKIHLVFLKVIHHSDMKCTKVIQLFVNCKSH